MGLGADEKDTSYLSKHWSVSFRLYLKKIVFRCGINDWVDDRLAFDGCSTILRFYVLEVQ